LPRKAQYAGLARDYVSRDDALASLALRASGLLRVRRILQHALPPEIAGAIEVANLRRGVLSIRSENAAVAAKLRQLAPRLITTCLEKGEEVSAIEVRIQGRATG
jgi:hypothetical protein